MTAEQKKGARNIGLAGASLGVGGIVGVALMALVKAQPGMVVGLLAQWGPVFFLCVLGIFVFERHAPSFIQAQKESAAATQKLADSVQSIAKKDDMAARERELLLTDIAYVLKQVKEKVDVIEDRQASSGMFRAAAGGQG